MKYLLTIALLCTVLGTSFTSFSQYRYDFGIKMSTVAQERFHLEQRFHIANPFTLVGTYAFGSETSNYYVSELNQLDSTLSTSSSWYRAQTHTIKFGVQRDINWLASDVFYVGGNVGFGFRQYQGSIRNSVYALQDSVAFSPPHFQGAYKEISSSSNINDSDAVLAQLGITFGMDVPLTKRLQINVELGLLYNFGTYVGHKIFFTEMNPAISGGLRYQFGMRE